MKNYLLSVLILFFACSSGKNTINKVAFKKEFTGIVTPEILFETPYNTWFKKRYELYELSDSLTTTMQKYSKGIKVKAFIGLWCGDSKREIPSLLKIAKEINLPEKSIEIIAVDHKKKANGLEKEHAIFRVPTFIFYRSNKEIGRFVEFPQESLEDDILKIISGKPYKHFYQE